MTRIDSEGRDVTDLPGLWGEEDKEIDMTDAEKRRVLSVLECTISYTSDPNTTEPLKNFAKNKYVWTRSGMMSHIVELERKLKLVTSVNRALMKELEGNL